jgi:hypothetical protein
MLGASNIIAFAATIDSRKARVFYERVLGLRPSEFSDALYLFETSPSPFRSALKRQGFRRSSRALPRARQMP